MKETEPLADYKKKRDFRVTPEPAGGKARKAGNSFVIQKHAARRLHYDLRLEIGGVLKSWAVTKEPSLDPGIKRLAVETEDHPLEYAAFEGVIPAGYGAGKVEIWDRGRWISDEDDNAAALEEGTLRFVLRGKRLNGAFVLVRLKGDDGKKTPRRNWLLIKRDDEHANAGTDKKVSATVPNKRPARGKGKLKHIPPQLAVLESSPPEGDDWLHEIKYDGYRMEALLEGGSCRLITRNGLDWSDRYPAIVKAASKLGAQSAILDGELVALDKDGRCRFSDLQNKATIPSLVCFWFDLLHLDGADLRKRPLLERKKKLEELLTGADPALRYSSHIIGSGQRVAESACAMGLEGVVSKNASAPYASGRHATWIKSKCILNDEFVVAGWRRSTTKSRPFASLLLGEYENGVLKYRGRVGSGFNDATLEEIKTKLAPLRTEKSPFSPAPAMERRMTVWVKPRVVAQVAYIERTGSGALRHPVFLGVRHDKEPQEMKAEPARHNGADDYRGVRLTHPAREMFPGSGITKKHVAEHYVLCGARFLEHASGRPVSLIRCPEGAGEKCFFQKHGAAAAPKGLSTAKIAEKGGKAGDYLVIDDEASVISAVQISAIEFHLWGSKIDRIEKPDRLVFDLDPDESLPFRAVRDAALAIREALRELSLESFPLLTGGKGVHVVAPLRRTREWPEVKEFSRCVAMSFAKTAPTIFVAAASKARRTGRIFIDWMRNQRGATAIAPYSLRARDGAPVAAPISWNELKTIESGHAFTIATIGKRLDRASLDPWPGYAAINQSIRKDDYERVTGGS